MPTLLQMPSFLVGTLEPAAYARWLKRKAAAHVRRDRKRGHLQAALSDYRKRIHEAVCRQGQHDFYTGEKLDWSLVSTYNGDEAAAGRSTYKAGFALLPTLDHIERPDGGWDFAICGWRTNDAKSDLNSDDFIALCRTVIAHAERTA